MCDSEFLFVVVLKVGSDLKTHIYFFDSWISINLSVAMHYSYSQIIIRIKTRFRIMLLCPTWWPLEAGTVWSRVPKCPRSTPSPPPWSSRWAASRQQRNSSWLGAGRGSCPQNHMTRKPAPLQENTQTGLRTGRNRVGDIRHNSSLEQVKSFHALFLPFPPGKIILPLGALLLFSPLSQWLLFTSQYTSVLWLKQRRDFKPFKGV